MIKKTSNALKSCIKDFMKDKDMAEVFAYLAVLTSMAGEDAVSINLGIMQLSIFRLCVILMVYAMVMRIIRKKEKISLIGNGENRYSLIFMLIWFAYAIITLIWVKDYSGWLKAVYFIGLGTLCAIAFGSIFNKKHQILTCLRLVSFMIILHNLWGWYEVNTGNYIFLGQDKLAKYLVYHYPVTTFANTNDFGTFMFVSIIILCICIAISKRKSEQYVYLAAMASSIFLLYQTNSRANMYGLVISAATFLILSVRRIGLKTIIAKIKEKFGQIGIIAKIKDKIGSRNIVIILAILGVILFITLLPAISSKLNVNFSAKTGSVSVRKNLIINGFDFLIRTFGFGTGAGNVEYWMVNYGRYNTEGIANMHNWWMEILTGYGVIVFALYAAFYLRLFRSMYRRFFEGTDRSDRIISMGIMCCLAGFVIGAISSSSNISKEWLWVFWAICIAFQGVKWERTINDKN